MSAKYRRIHHIPSHWYHIGSTLRSKWYLRSDKPATNPQAGKYPLDRMLPEYRAGWNLTGFLLNSVIYRLIATDSNSSPMLVK